MKLPIYSTLLVFLLFPGAENSRAQNTSPAQPTTTPAPAATPAPADAPPTLDEMQQRLDAAKSDGSMDDVLKQAVTKRYEEAVEAITNAQTFHAAEEEYRAALRSAPEETKKIQAQIETLKKSRSEPNFDRLKDNKEISDTLAKEQREIAPLKGDLGDLQKALAQLKTRPDEIQVRLTAAKKELADTKTELAGLANEDSISNKATGDRLRALQATLEAEIAMLEQEDLSNEVRMGKADASRELLELQIADAESRIAALQKRASEHTSDQVEQAESLVDSIQKEVPDAGEDLQSLVDEMHQLIEETKKVSDSIEQAEKDYEERDKAQKQIANEFDRVSGQFKLGSDAKSLAPILLEKIRTLPTNWESSQILSKTKRELSEARSRLYAHDKTVPGDPAHPEQVPPAVPEKYRPEVEKLFHTRDALQETLKTNYKRQIRALENLTNTEQRIEEQSAGFRSLAMEKLFWVRTSTVMGPEAFRSIPEGFAYCYGPLEIKDLVGRAKQAPVFFYVLLAFLALVLFLPRPLYYKGLASLSRKTRHVSYDHYSYTVWAFILTALLALPFPALMIVIGFSLAIQPSATEWSHGLSLALMTSAGFLYQMLFLIALSRKDGLGERHFGWNREMLHRIRRLTILFVPIFLLGSITVSLVTLESSASYLSGMGRLAVLMLVIGGGTLFALLLHPTKGVAATMNRISPSSTFGKLRRFWFFLVIGTNAVLTVLLLAGFVYTVFLLQKQIEKTLVAALISFVLYGLLLRWFTIRERRIAREKALAERRKQLADKFSQKDASSGESSSEELSREDLEEANEMNLVSVKEQTRNFLGFLIGIFFLLQVYGIWSDFGPVVEVLSQTKALGDLSIVDIAFSILVIVITVSCVRNLPGILESLVLSRFNVESGTRSAVVTLCQYAAIAIGGIVLFRNLGVDWAQFGWIAAALSVGLGFGLQEVVANFVSGIILLFERPIRVGDVVTVDGIDGIVSRIQIRATTITTWDRKEFIVPNKQFVTGTLLNWTRGNSINRIMIPVGVAYGSDTERARQILLDIAADHPRLMNDPGPIASFEEFGDSCLKLVLRCYLPDMDNRLGTITELHEEIDRRYREAGIEISFPQMDVHLDMANGGEIPGTPGSHPKE